MNAAIIGDSACALVTPAPPHMRAAIDDLMRVRDLLVIDSPRVGAREWPERYRAAAACSARLAGWWAVVARHLAHSPAGWEIHQWAALRARDAERTEARRWRAAARATELATTTPRTPPAPRLHML